MNLVISQTSILLWHEVVKQAEKECSIVLDAELEAYLTSLLIHYTNKPEVSKQLFAKAFLEAMQLNERQRNTSLRSVGDQCLLFAGLFPRSAQKKHVKIGYFVNLGRSAYANLSGTANDLYWTLAYQFVALMDVLQSIRQTPDLMPLEAYEQWQEVGSQRAYQILQQYSPGIPIKKLRG